MAGEYHNNNYIKETQIENLKSTTVPRNTFIFGVIMMILQIGICLTYGLLVVVPPRFLNISSVITMISLAILIVAGFGLVFSYLKRLVWSGIGFTLLITALCIQFYPLINAFWTKTVLQDNNPQLNFDSSQYVNLYLSNREIGDQTTLSTHPYYGNCLTNALKCALAVAVAFSAILGRAGQLECLIVTIFGIIGFELNRQLVQRQFGADAFGSLIIFTFGGFMGLGLGFFMFIRQRREDYKINIVKYYNADLSSSLIAAIGALVIFVFMPFLAYEVDAYIFFSDYTTYVNPLCVILGMAAGAIGSAIISGIANDCFIPRDIIHGPIAGAVAVGTSSLYIIHPVYALVAGLAGGLIQGIIQNAIEKSCASKRTIISTISWSLFGFQGMVGASFAAGWKALAYTSSVTTHTISTNVLNQDGTQSYDEFLAGLICAGMGLGFGILTGIIVLIVNGQNSYDHFDDKTYWIYNDCINYHVKEEYQEDVMEPEENLEYDFSEGEEVKNNHAYL